VPHAIEFSQDTATESQPNDFVTHLQQSQQEPSCPAADLALRAILKLKEKLRLTKGLVGATCFFNLRWCCISRWS